MWKGLNFFNLKTFCNLKKNNLNLIKLKYKFIHKFFIDSMFTVSQINKTFSFIKNHWNFFWRQWKLHQNIIFVNSLKSYHLASHHMWHKKFILSQIISSDWQMMIMKANGTPPQIPGKVEEMMNLEEKHVP